MSEQILREILESKLIRSSKYREEILEFVDIVRKHGYKFKQIRYSFGGTNNRVCIMGLYNTIKGGNPHSLISPINMETVHYIAMHFNDEGWTFNQIADELERGVSLV